MRMSTARRLNQLNALFYERETAAFSATRRGYWPGWDRCLSQVEPGLGFRVLDVACGNVRFARYLAEKCPQVPFAYRAVDNNRELARVFEPPGDWDFSFVEADVVEGLLTRVGHHKDAKNTSFSPLSSSSFGPLSSSNESGFAERSPYSNGWGENDWGSADLTVCFGFLHHVPSKDARALLLRDLLCATDPGGTCCVSFWRFMSEPKLAAKALRATEEGLATLGIPREELDPGDYLLGWQNEPGVYRYCHSFDDAEIDGMLARVAGFAQVVDRFCADGRSGTLNEYLVLRRR